MVMKVGPYSSQNGGRIVLLISSETLTVRQFKIPTTIQTDFKRVTKNFISISLFYFLDTINRYLVIIPTTEVIKCKTIVSKF